MTPSLSDTLNEAIDALAAIEDSTEKLHNNLKTVYGGTTDMVQAKGWLETLPGDAKKLDTAFKGLKKSKFLKLAKKIPALGTAMDVILEHAPKATAALKEASKGLDRTADLLGKALFPARRLLRKLVQPARNRTGLLMKVNGRCATLREKLESIRDVADELESLTGIYGKKVNHLRTRLRLLKSEQARISKTATAIEPALNKLKEPVKFAAELRKTVTEISMEARNAYSYIQAFVDVMKEQMERSTLARWLLPVLEWTVGLVNKGVKKLVSLTSLPDLLRNALTTIADKAKSSLRLDLIDDMITGITKLKNELESKMMRIVSVDTETTSLLKDLDSLQAVIAEARRKKAFRGNKPPPDKGNNPGVGGHSNRSQKLDYRVKEIQQWLNTPIAKTDVWYNTATYTSRGGTRQGSFASFRPATYRRIERFLADSAPIRCTGKCCQGRQTQRIWLRGNIPARYNFHATASPDLKLTWDRGRFESEIRLQNVAIWSSFDERLEFPVERTVVVVMEEIYHLLQYRKFLSGRPQPVSRDDDDAFGRRTRTWELEAKRWVLTTGSLRQLLTEHDRALVEYSRDNHRICIMEGK